MFITSAIQLLENPISALAPPSQKPSPGNSMQLEQLIFNSFVVLDDGLMMIMVISEHYPEKIRFRKNNLFGIFSKFKN